MLIELLLKKHLRHIGTDLKVKITRMFNQYGHNYPTRSNSIQFIYICQRSTCFGWYFHPSPGAHNTVPTVFGINETVTATCGERLPSSHDRWQ